MSCCVMIESECCILLRASEFFLIWNSSSMFLAAIVNMDLRNISQCLVEAASHPVDEQNTDYCRSDILGHPSEGIHAL